ncbi:cation-translocating P-type ATPase [Microgenomates group bacterium]|nr:cation-translocating P-type ATPase [Microgenomates group bacterium]
MFNKSVEEVKKLTGTGDEGLTAQEAQERLRENGKNLIQEGKKTPEIVRFLKQFKHLIVLILLVAFALSLTIAIMENNPQEYVSAMLILVAVLLNATIGFAQETKAAKAIEALHGEVKPYARVLREGEIEEIKTEDLVVGDIVLLEAGSIVSADMRLIEVASLQIEEAVLTGESAPVRKNMEVMSELRSALGDQHNMAWMGSTVTYGRGRGIVVATGMKTQMGRIAEYINEQKPPQTPLNKRLDKTMSVIAIAVSIIAVGIFISRLVIGQEIIPSLILTIAIAVCAVPEAVPICASITMALATQRMSKRKAIIRNLSAVETLGSTEVICSDKTGTITLNKMTVQKIYVPSKYLPCELEVDGNNMAQIDGYRENGSFRALNDCMLLCNDVQTKDENGGLATMGSPTETALVHCAHCFGYSKEYVEEKRERIDELPFDNQRKMMSTVNRSDKEAILYTKGAGNNVLAKCKRILEDGKIRELADDDKKNIEETISKLARSSLRVLAFAYKPLGTDEKKITFQDEDGLIFLGLAGMIDPPRQEVGESVKACREAGIKVVMITGDHRETAMAIAKQIGIMENESQILTGAELDEMSDEDLQENIDKYSVYARVNPEHKVRIVDIWQRKEKVVAMTGDGANDAASIKGADVGIGMGISGTDITKSVADIVLADDNFATIVSAVEEGRRTYANIKKIFIYLLCLSLSELVLLTVIIGFLGYKDLLFFNPILILWINLVTDTLPALALGTLEAEKDVMQRGPNITRGSLFRGRTGESILVYSAFMTVLVLAVYFGGLWGLRLEPIVCVTMSYLVLATIETVQGYNLYSHMETIFNGHCFKNKWLNLAFIASCALVVIPVVVPAMPLQTALGTTSINGYQWLLAVGIGLGMIPLAEIYKVTLRYRDRKYRKNQL